MRIKVIGENNFKEVLSLDEGATAGDLRDQVIERLEDVDDVELFCMGKRLADADTIQAGCVVHMNPVRSRSRPRNNDNSSPSEEEKRPEDVEEARDSIGSLDSAARLAAGRLLANAADDMLRERMDDPARIAEYRRRVQEQGLDPDVFERRLQEKVKIIKKFQYYIMAFLIFSVLELLTYIASPLTKFWFPVKVLWGLSIVVAFMSLLMAIGVNTMTGIVIRVHMFMHCLWILMDIFFIISSCAKFPPFKKAFEQGDWVYLGVWVGLDLLLRVGRIVGSRMYLKYYDMLTEREHKFAYRTCCCSRCCEALQGGFGNNGEE